MIPHLEPQRTIAYPPDPPDDLFDTPIPTVKRPSRKGVNIGAKWEFTDEEITRLRVAGRFVQKCTRP